MCNEAYRLLAFYNSNESSASTHICKLPSRYNLAYSSGSSTASEVNAQSDPGVVLNPFRLPSSQCEAYSQHLYKCQCCFVVDCILQILFSSYPISLSFNKCSKNSPTSSGGEMNCTSEHVCSRKSYDTEITLVLITLM